MYHALGFCGRGTLPQAVSIRRLAKEGVLYLYFRFWVYVFVMTKKSKKHTEEKVPLKEKEKAAATSHLSSKERTTKCSGCVDC